MAIQNVSCGPWSASGQLQWEGFTKCQNVKYIFYNPSGSITLLCHNNCIYRHGNILLEHQQAQPSSTEAVYSTMFWQNYDFILPWVLSLCNHTCPTYQFHTFKYPFLPDLSYILYFMKMLCYECAGVNNQYALSGKKHSELCVIYPAAAVKYEW